MKPFSLKTIENLYVNWGPLLLSGKWLTESSTPLPKTPQPTTYLQIYQKLTRTFLVFSFFFRPPHISFPFPSSRLHASSAGGSSTSPVRGQQSHHCCNGCRGGLGDKTATGPSRQHQPRFCIPESMTISPHGAHSVQVASARLTLTPLVLPLSHFPV